MSPRVDPVRTTSELPAEADVVVIGGGIVGASTALFLAERGVSVALCEKGTIAGEQSSRNWGWCRKMGRDLAEVPLAVESLRLWEGMNARTNAETGFRQTGIVYLCETANEAAKHEAWLAQAALLSDRLPPDRPRRDRQAPARLVAPLARRALHAKRRLRRAGEGHLGHRQRRLRQRRCRSSSVAPCAGSRQLQGG